MRDAQLIHFKVWLTSLVANWAFCSQPLMCLKTGQKWLNPDQNCLNFFKYLGLQSLQTPTMGVSLRFWHVRLKLMRMQKSLFFSYYRTKSVLETKIFEKFWQFYSRKSSLREVFNMIKGKQDLGPFLVVGIPTKHNGLLF